MTPRFRWSLATPLLVLVGLFGMHGLGEHSEAGSHAETAMAAPMSASLSTPGLTPASTALPIATSQPTTLLPATPDLGMAMNLCLAVLLGAFVAWLLLAGPSRRTTWLLPRQATTALPVPRGRAPDPPSLHALSVYRC